MNNISLREQTITPFAQWQGQARKFIAGAVDQLWNDSRSLGWLRLERGLADKTIWRFRLGWIPAGIVIPLVENGEVVRIRIRRRNGEPRYYVLPGCDTRPLILGAERKVFVVVESELDALLIQQEAGDLVGVVALGSSSTKPDWETAEILRRAERVLISLGDNEEAWWVPSYFQAVRWPPVGGKNPCDMRKAGMSVRDWVLAGLGRMKDVAA